jgi:hypothetical protein
MPRDLSNNHYYNHRATYNHITSDYHYKDYDHFTNYNFNLHDSNRYNSHHFNFEPVYYNDNSDPYYGNHYKRNHRHAVCFNSHVSHKYFDYAPHSRLDYDNDSNRELDKPGY